jgi:DNA-binding CsgD family transcriptional regulator
MNSLLAGRDLSDHFIVTCEQAESMDLIPLHPYFIVVKANSCPEHLLFLLDHPEVLGLIFDDGLPERLREHLARAAAGQARSVGPPLTSPLTPCERAVLHGVGLGQTNKVIARQLGKSEHTVKNQLTSILRKLRLCSRYELRRSYLGQALPPLPQQVV